MTLKFINSFVEYSSFFQKEMKTYLFTHTKTRTQVAKCTLRATSSRLENSTAIVRRRHSCTRNQNTVNTNFCYSGFIRKWITQKLATKLIYSSWIETRGFFCNRFFDAICQCSEFVVISSENYIIWSVRRTMGRSKCQRVLYTIDTAKAEYFISLHFCLSNLAKLEGQVYSKDATGTFNIVRLKLGVWAKKTKLKNCSEYFLFV